MRYKIKISYDGTRFCGWQVQKNGISIQETIQKALELVLQHKILLTGSGRTDAGVHAKGQVAHFDTDISLDLKIFPLTLNSLLPSDIRILEIEETSSDFHARYSAKKKIYHYHLYLKNVLDPFQKLYCHHVKGRFDPELLKKGAKYFLGTHDFTSFANVKPDSPEDKTRTLSRLDVIETQSGIRLEFEGDGFLYKMVRNITGTLVDLGRGKIKEEDILAILEKKDRKSAKAAAPAQGLFLEEVVYFL